MIVYEMYAGDGHRQIFRTLTEAKKYIEEMGFEFYTIDKCKMARPSIEKMIDVINSQGGSWCMQSERVYAKGF